MMDHSGRLKFIDFGLSEYFGISPTIKNVAVFLDVDFNQPPDGDPIRYGPEYLKRQRVTPRTLNLDVFSIGVLMLNEILDGPYSKYLFDDSNILEFTNSSNYRDFKIINRGDFNELIDDNLFDLLCKMVWWNSFHRPTAKECLKHQYFTGVPFIPDIENLPIRTILINNQYREYSNNNLELKYLNEIHQSTKNFKFPKIRRMSNINININMFFMLTSWLIEVAKGRKLPINVFLNSIPKIFNLFDSQIKIFFLLYYILKYT
jgi:serine/threonine protein kinase